MKYGSTTEIAPVCRSMRYEARPIVIGRLDENRLAVVLPTRTANARDMGVEDLALPPIVHRLDDQAPAIVAAAEERQLLAIGRPVRSAVGADDLGARTGGLADDDPGRVEVDDIDVPGPHLPAKEVGAVGRLAHRERPSEIRLDAERTRRRDARPRRAAPRVMVGPEQSLRNSTNRPSRVHMGVWSLDASRMSGVS